MMQMFASPGLVRTFAEPFIVVFAPHMDDEVIGPGGTIALHRQAGATVTHVFLTDGLGSGPELREERISAEELERRRRDLGETRKRESREAAELVGIKELIFLDAPDGKLHETPEIVDRVHRILEEKKPNLIYAPSIVDDHRDHRATNRILRLALEQLPKEIASGILIRGYEVWTPLPANRMVDISPVEALKRQAINLFASQTRFVDYARAILGLNQFRSMIHLFGRSTAEAFWECTWAEYKSLVDQTLLSKSGKQVLEYATPPQAGGIDPETLPGVVIDDENAHRVGFTAVSSSLAPFVGTGYRHDGNDRRRKQSAEFLPDLPAPGRYEVRLAYTAHPNRATNVTVSVTHADGAEAMTVNQRKAPPIDKLWVSLGAFGFAKGKAGSVTVTNAGADGYVVIDAIQWLPVEK